LHPSIAVVGFTASEERDAFAIVERLRQIDQWIPVVLLPTEGSERLAVSAFRMGVNDYYPAPVDYEAFIAGITRQLARKEVNVDRASHDRSPAKHLLGPSAAMREIRNYLEMVADRDVTVLITGETGTGKELAASLIHERSRRRQHHFVSVNCAALPEALLESELFGHENGAFTGAVGVRQGLLQAADRGTVFLDEIGDMGVVAQAKVLRAIETREVYRLGGKKPIPLDVRIIAATNQDLDRAMNDGHFRKDLYFRINVARVHLPPLRERRADIVPLLEHYLRILNPRGGRPFEGFSTEAVDALQSYDWPGNVRELKNLVEAILIVSPAKRLTVKDLPEDFRRRLQQLCSLPDTERRRLIEALLTAKWNKSKAASLLHCSRMTLYRKMAKYSVTTSDETCTTVSQAAGAMVRHKSSA
jgi:DNA-binding NtrC family response regulator